MVDYIINEGSVVQIAGVIFRPIDNYTYLITMDPSELNLETYAMLQNGCFEIDRMNKISTNRDDDECFDLFGFLGENPSGIDEELNGHNSTGPGQSGPPQGPNGKNDYPPTRLFGKSCERHSVIVGYNGPENPVFGTIEYCCRHTFGIRHTCGWDD